MAREFPINASYGVILTDEGSVIPVNSEGPIDLEDRDELLQLVLAAAVETEFLHSELKDALGGFRSAMESLRSFQDPSIA